MVKLDVFFNKVVDRQACNHSAEDFVLLRDRQDFYLTVIIKQSDTGGVRKTLLN
jgi:hypothetical protein